MKEQEDQSIEARALGLARTFAPGALVVGTVATGLVAGPSLGVLVLAGGALVGAISAMWASVRALVGETPLAAEDAFALGAPSSEEEQKRAVLRAIKDIEFERAVGKISEEDFRVLLARYRGEAKQLLRRIDESRAPERARAEALAEAHLGGKIVGWGEASDSEAPAESVGPHRDDAPPSSEATPERRRKGKGRRERAREAQVKTLTCSRCRIANDADATFCKGCGARLDPNDDADLDLLGDKHAKPEEGSS